MAETAASSINNFTIKFFKDLFATKGKDNIFFSPSSIVSAFSMLYAGAAGDTAKEIRDALCYGAAADGDLHKSFSVLTGALNKAGTQYKLRNANKVYTQQNFPVEAAFANCTKENYAAEAEAVDFATRAEELRQEINKWVEVQTEEKIKDLLPGGSLDALTRLVLVNAIYFKGNWADQFNPQFTREMEFHVDEQTRVPVQMMMREGKYGIFYDSKLQVQACEVPYVGKELTFTVLLPTQHGGLAKLQQALTAEYIDNVTAKMKYTNLQLFLPKFKLSETYELHKLLPGLGMKKVFKEGECDLTGISAAAGQDLYVSCAVHKSFIEVNEEGTEAAAATGIAVQLRCLPPQVQADKPFLFVIRHVAHNTLLFVGVVRDPTLAAQ